MELTTRGDEIIPACGLPDLAREVYSDLDLFAV
jgi:hypothetical protein